MSTKQIVKRMYDEYIKKYIFKILLAAFFSILVAGSTSSIAWLLDPAIKKLFIDKDQSLIFLIPILIIIAFTTKGLSLYFAKATMIGVGESIKKKLQYDMINNLVSTDTQVIDKKHSGKFISNLTYDVTHITNLLSNAILTLFKDSLTLIGLLIVMFMQNWKLALISIIMIPLASISAKTLGAPPDVVVTIKCLSLNLHTIPSSFIIPSSPNIRAYLEVIGFIFVKAFVYIRFINSKASFPLTSIFPRVLPSKIPAVFLVCSDSL